VRSESHYSSHDISYLHSSRCHGPFAQAINSIAEIADGAPVPDIEKARNDLMFLFSLQHHLKGGFYEAMWNILARTHEILADVITEQEAKAMMGEEACWLDLDAPLGHIHPLEKQEDGTFHTYDATYLRRPLGEIRYARYELLARVNTYKSIKQVKTGSNQE
jgi:hypothetical protein